MKSEIRKIIRFPVFWVLIIASLILNCFVVCQYSFESRNIKIINEYVKTGAVSKNDDYGVCEQHEEGRKSAYDTYYKDFATSERTARTIKALVVKPDETTQKIIDKNCKKAQQRVEEIKADGEAMEEYYVGDMFSLHYNMYQAILILLLLEILIITILITSYLMKYEENFATSQILYISKKGKGVAKTKCLASVFISGGTAFGIELITYGMFLIRVPQLWDFLNSSVSSAMASEYRSMFTGTYPLITWIKMSQQQYLLCVILLSSLIAMFMSLLTSAVSFVSKNAYINVLLTVLICFAVFTFSIYINTPTVFSYVLVFNPIMVIYLCFDWFMESSTNIFNSYQGYETLVMVIYMIIMSGVTAILYNRFRKKDVY